MRRPFLPLALLVILLLPCGLVWAQDGPAPGAPEDPLQLESQARILYVARSLKLRVDQIPKLIPLLNNAQERLQQRTVALDGLYVRGQAPLMASNQALMAGNAPDRAVQTAVERLAAARDQALAVCDRDLERIGDQVLAVFDKQQLEKVQTLQDHQVQLRNQERYQGTADLAVYVARYAGGMRQLLAEEYDSLRVPMALRLAQQLAAPNAPGYNRAVADMLKVLDSVRRLSDAQFAQAEPQLPRSIAKALGLPQEAVAQFHAVSFEDLIFFVSSPQSASLLQTFKADPAMEVAP